MLEELGVPYEVIRYERNRVTMLAPPELRQIHPLGKSPVVRDGSRVIAESGAILEYLVDRFGEGKGLRPLPESDDYLRHRYFMHYAEGSAMPPLLLKLVLSKMGPLGWPVRPYVAKQIQTHLEFLEGELQTRDYFAGAFSSADIQMSFPLEAAAARGGLDDKLPKLHALLGRLRARPAYKKAIEVGGPYSLG